jgi:hypothetical protein
MQEKHVLLVLPGMYGALFPGIPPQTSLQVAHLTYQREVETKIF